MRGRPDGATTEIETLLECCADIESRIDSTLPDAALEITSMATDALIVHLRVSWVVEQLHRVQLIRDDDRLQNAADAVAARDELACRIRSAKRHPSISGPSR